MASSMASRLTGCFTNQAWSDIDIRAMLWCEFCIMYVSLRMRSGMQTSASCPLSRTTRLEIGDGGENDDADPGAEATWGADAGTGAVVAEAGAGSATGVAAVAGSGWAYTSSVGSVGAMEISVSRGWCHVTSRECTTILVSASITLNQSLPWL